MTSNSGKANSHKDPYIDTISVPEAPGPPKFMSKGPKEGSVDAGMRIRSI